MGGMSEERLLLTPEVFSGRVEVGSMTESEWWQWYAKPYLAAELAAGNLDSLNLRRNSLHIWSLPRQ
jgi:hypothetical protein